MTALHKVTVLNWNRLWAGESRLFVYNYLGLVYSEEAVGEKAWFMKRSNKTMLSVYFSFIKLFRMNLKIIDVYSRGKPFP